jgi:hypothetical protein
MTIRWHGRRHPHRGASRTGLLVAILLTVLAPAVPAQPAADPGGAVTFFACRRNGWQPHHHGGADRHASRRGGAGAVPAGPKGFRPALGAGAGEAFRHHRDGSWPAAGADESHVWFDPGRHSLFRIRSRSGGWTITSCSGSPGGFRRQRTGIPVEAAQTPESGPSSESISTPMGRRHGLPAISELDLIYLRRRPRSGRQGARPCACFTSGIFTA